MWTSNVLGGFLYYSIAVVFLSSTVFGQEQETTIEDQESTMEDCVDVSYQLWLKILLNKFIRYADLTAAMSSSRRLFDVFFNQKISAGAFKDYCREHRYARALFNRCDNSTYKKMVVSNFGLADYICMTRVGDYGQALSCLRDAHNWATVICKSNCSQYENNSKIFLNEDTDIDRQSVDIMQAMAGDCSYLKCMVTCRRPMLEEECGKEIASLESDALRTTFATSWDLYEPPEIRQMIKGGYQSSYPSECRQLANEDVFDSGESQNISNDNDTLNKSTSRKVRMLVAVSTNVLTNTSLMCRFGNRIKQFFTSYCPDEMMDEVDSDWISLAVAVP